MIVINPSSTDRYHMATRNTLPLVHRRKLCPCGVVVTAKQLIQYGKCVSCVRADSLKG